MNILETLLRNLQSETLTHQPNDRVPPPSRYRGQLVHDTSRCIGCAACAYACSPSAITFDDQTGEHIAWQYDAGRCVFCGQCVALCPTHALSFAPQPMPLATSQSELQVEHIIQYQPCADCGKPIIPLSVAALQHVVNGPLRAAILEHSDLCEACRKRTTAETIKRSYFGERK